MAEKKSCVEAFVVSAWRAALWVLERLPVSSRGLIADLERIIPQTRRTQQSSRRLWSQSVLQRLALQYVADSLHALREDANALKAASDWEHAAKISLDLTRQQMQTGHRGVKTG